MQKNIMDKIDAIEKQAEAIINNAISKKASFGTNLNNEINEIDEKIKNDTEKKINEMKASREKIINEKIASLQSAYDKKTLSLDKDFQNNKEIYVNNIFKKIIED